jgi:DNA-directed RNA polymerase sigma subunit (sigma70/sigma32)
MAKNTRKNFRGTLRAMVVERREYVKSLRAKGMTLQAIGDELGVTKERVRQILDKAKLDEAS